MPALLHNSKDKLAANTVERTRGGAHPFIYATGVERLRLTTVRFQEEHLLDLP